MMRSFGLTVKQILKKLMATTRSVNNLSSNQKNEEIPNAYRKPLKPTNDWEKKG